MGSGSTTETDPTTNPTMATPTTATTTGPATTTGEQSEGSTGDTEAQTTGSGSSSSGEASSESGSSSTGDEDIQCEGPQGNATCETPSPYDGAGDCDPYAQDCPEGERCVPWINDHWSWNDTRCSPLAEVPDQLGDPCLVEEWAGSGIDSCDVGLMCFGADGTTNIGECIELCGCGPEQATCSGGGTECSIGGDGALPLCLPTCDPLAPIEESPCPEGFGCYLYLGDFRCGPDASFMELGVYGDACVGLNDCDSGLGCLAQDTQPDCGSEFGCCTPTCDLDEDACPDGLECVPAFEEGMAPEPCHEDTGYCRLPVRVFSEFLGARLSPPQALAVSPSQLRSSDR